MLTIKVNIRTSTYNMTRLIFVLFAVIYFAVAHKYNSLQFTIKPCCFCFSNLNVWNSYKEKYGGFIHFSFSFFLYIHQNKWKVFVLYNSPQCYCFISVSYTLTCLQSQQLVGWVLAFIYYCTVETLATLWSGQYKAVNIIMCHSKYIHFWCY